jgi:hypothetical protein
MTPLLQAGAAVHQEIAIQAQACVHYAVTWMYKSVQNGVKMNIERLPFKGD